MFRLGKSKLIFLLLVGALLVSVASYAANAATGSISISVANAPNASSTGGAFAKVTGLAGTFTAPSNGAAETVAGVSLFKITFADPSTSDHVRIQILWNNPNDVTKVLKNPHAFIQVRTYYATSTSACPSDYRTVGTSTTVCPTSTRSDSPTELTFGQGSADGTLQPTQSNQDNIYILADITTGKNVVPGQQTDLSGLDFTAIPHKT